MGRSPGNILHALLHLSFYRVAFGMNSPLNDTWDLTMPDSTIPFLNIHEIEMDASEELQDVREILKAQKIAEFEEDYAIFFDELQPTERDDLLKEVLYRLQVEGLDDRISYITDEVSAKQNAVALRMANSEMNKNEQ